jgi:hypothetical protein
MPSPDSLPIFLGLGLGSNIGHGIFVEGWVDHPDIFSWVSFLYPTYLPAFFCYQRNQQIDRK